MLKNKKWILAGALLLVALASATPVSTHGQLAVTNGQVVDASGKPPQLRGMSFYWDNWDQGFYNSSAVSSLASDWKVGVIRAAVYDQNVTTTENMINWAISAGVYVIIDNHNYCAYKATSAAQTFFQQISSYVKSKGNPVNVIYEVYNEPVYTDCDPSQPNSVGTAAAGIVPWSSIKSYAQTIISTIRQNDPKNLIVVGTPFYSQQLNAAEADPITSSINIAYTLHFYASESAHTALQPTLKYAYCLPFPVFITEWGVSEASGTGNFTTSMNNTWIGVIESLKLSWVNWSLNDNGATSDALNGGSSTTGPFTNLTASGTFVKNLITTYANGGTVNGISSSSIDCSVYSSSSAARTGGGDITTGVIQAENYATITNETQDTSSKAQEGAYIANTTAGGKTTYSLTSPDSGVYIFQVLVASAVSTGSLQVSLGSQSVAIPITSTGGVSAWAVKSIALHVAKGAQTMTFTYNGTANTYGVDAFAFSVPDSADSVNFNLKVPVSTLQQRRLSASQLTWNAAHDQVTLPAEAGIRQAELMNSKGQIVQDWSFGDSGKQMTLDLSRQKRGGLLILVLKGDFGYSTVTIPSVH